MKRVLAVLLCVMMVGSVFAMAISAGAVENEEVAPVAAVATDELGETYEVDETVAETLGVDATTQRPLLRPLLRLPQRPLSLLPALLPLLPPPLLPLLLPLL